MPTQAIIYFFKRPLNKKKWTKKALIVVDAN